MSYRDIFIAHIQGYIMNNIPLYELLRAGAGTLPATLAIKNAQLVNVHTSEIYKSDVAIYKEYIVATGDITAYIGDYTQIIDAHGYYLVPGLIDGHLHIECSKLSMTHFAQAVIPHGTTSVISGLDQYLVIAGIDGIKEVLQEIEQSPLTVFWGLPFKTPYTVPESTVAFRVDSQTHTTLHSTGLPYGVWETVTEFLENEDADVLTTLEYARKHRIPIFGCNPMLTGNRLNAILTAGVRLDHESYTKEEALEKVRKGMFILLRESSVSHFLEENIAIITEHSPAIARRVSFCTDDVTARDIAQHGHMDKVIRLAIQCGVNPITAIQMGSLNSAEAYRIDDIVGSIAPGKIANILLVSNLDEFIIDSVIAKGILCVDKKKEIYSYTPPQRSTRLQSTITIPEITQERIALHSSIPSATKAKVLSMEVDYNIPFVRTRKEGYVPIHNGMLQCSVEDDILHAIVVERFGINGNIGKGFVSGWGLKKGAIASTKAPDDNNIVCIGTNHSDMVRAITYLAEQGGGQVIVIDNEIIEYIALPICGIVGDYTPQELAIKEERMLHVIRELGSSLPDPMFYMSCLQITAIPEYALIDKGCVSFSEQQCINPILALE